MEKKSFTNSYMRYSIRFFCSVKFKQSISKYFSFFVYTVSHPSHEQFYSRVQMARLECSSKVTTEFST